MEQKNIRQHSKIVLVQNNHIFEEDDSYQQPMQEKLSEPALESNENEVELPLPKTIMRHWEEIKNNTN
jgi:hypothetical protein